MRLFVSDQTSPLVAEVTGVLSSNQNNFNTLSISCMFIFFFTLQTMEDFLETHLWALVVVFFCDKLTFFITPLYLTCQNKYILDSRSFEGQNQNLEEWCLVKL